MSRQPLPRRTLADYARVLEAAACLMLAQGAIRVVPFRWLTRVFTRPLLKSELTGEARVSAITDVRWAVIAAAVRLPSQPVCFPRAVAAQTMLRRRGVSTTLTYGATMKDKELQAHVWLTSGAQAVVGFEAAADHLTLLIYSNSVV